MKLTTFLLLIALMQVSAAGFGQKVTLKANGITMNNIFNQIRKQTGFSVLVDGSDFSTNRKIDVNFSEAPLRMVLDELLKDSGFGYEIENKNILVERKEKTPIDQIAGRFQAIDVTGKVVDSEGKPLSGATVTVKGTKISATTQNDGSFTLRGVDDDAILIISYMGFEAKEIKAERNLEAIRLVASTNPLDEVQVIAYGTTTRRLSTGNIGTVKADVIEKQAGITNPLLALQGRVPGLVITENTGIRGGGITVRIQGQNSMKNGNAPLFVVDGMPIESFLSPIVGNDLLGDSGLERDGLNTQGNPLSYLNPTDIESIDILKDADATSIYGSRAANGAILITTKKGQVGKMQLDIKVNSGWSKAIESDFQMLNTRQYLDMRYEAFKNDGIDWRSPTIVAPDLKLWDTTRYTNWRKELMGGTARSQSVQLAVSGGTVTTQYRLSGSYNRAGSIFPDNGNGNPIGSVSTSINSISLDRKLSLTWSANYQYNFNEIPGGNFVQAAWLLPPHAPSPFNPDGSINWLPDADGNSTYLTNPYVKITQLNRTTTTNLISNIMLSYNLFRGFRVSSSMGYSNMITNTFIPQPKSSIQPEFRTSIQNSAAYGDRSNRSWIAEPQINYETILPFGKIEALAGATWMERESSGRGINGINYPSDILLDNIGSAGSLNVISSDYTQYKYLAYFGRLNYNFSDNLIINLSARRDGSSRFGKNRRFSNFYSFGTAWIFSQQRFLNEKLPWLSFGKLTINYGITGNDQIGDYIYTRTYRNYTTQIPYQGISALQSTTLPNPNLVWEKVKKFSAGLALGVLKDKIIYNMNYSQNHSDNQLSFDNLSSVTGSTSMIRNLKGVVIRNSTWEFSLNSVNVKNSDFEWNTGINFSIAKNKLVSYPNLSSSSDSQRYLIGEPIDFQRVYRFSGVNPTTGEYQFLDKNGNPRNSANGLNFPEDFIIKGNATPFYGGMQNGIKYRGFSLDIFMQFVQKWGSNFEFFNGTSGLTPGVFDQTAGGNQPATIMSRWQKMGDNARIAKFSTVSFNDSYMINSSDAYFTDASFIRIKNVSFSWQVPKSFTDKFRLQSARLIGSGQNLMTLTRYKGPDPETSGLISVPPLRVYTVGLQIIF